MLRAELEAVFADVLSQRDDADRVQLLDVLDTMLSWPTWEHLRTMNGRTEDEARAVLACMVGAMLLPEQPHH